MKQPGVIVTLLVFIAAVSFVVAAQQRQGARPLTAQLSGDSGGSGVAKVTLNVDESQLCYEVAVKNIATPSSVEILSIAKGRIISADLAKGSMSQCAVVERERLMDITRNPSSYFILVQNSDTAGALRGQLAR